METQADQVLTNTVWLKPTPGEVSTLGDILTDTGMRPTLWHFGSFDRAGFTLVGSAVQGNDIVRTFVCVVYDYERGRWSEALKSAVANYLAALGVWDQLQGDSSARFWDSISV